MRTHSKMWGAAIGAILALLAKYGIEIAAEHVALINESADVLSLIIFVLFPALGAERAPKNKP